MEGLLFGTGNHLRQPAQICGDLRKWATTKALVVCVVITLSAWLEAQVGLSSNELRLFNLLNQERAKAGQPKLQWDYHLAEAARAHNQLLANRRALSHQFLGEAELGERVGAKGLRFNAAAENVAEGDTVENIHQGLMNSPEHRANILSPKYNSIGLAIIAKGDELYVTQDFANVLPAYSERQFQDAVAAAFNKARQSSGIPAVAVKADAHLHDVACSNNDDAGEMIHELPGAVNLVVFTTSIPEKLPSGMQKVATDNTVHRMNTGTCFKPGKEHGYGSFRVVAAFYP